MSKMPEKHAGHSESTSEALAQWTNEGGAPSTGDVSTRKLTKSLRDLNPLRKRLVDITTGKVALGEVGKHGRNRA